MRNFIIYSKTASTSFNNFDLKKSGRWDILIHSVISAFFISNEIRDNCHVYLILMGKPNPPKTIRIKLNKDILISKKNILKNIQLCLKKSQKLKDNKSYLEVFDGFEISNKELDKVLEDLKNTNLFILDKKGEKFKAEKFSTSKDNTFILGDYDGFDKKVKKKVKQVQKISLNNSKTYFTSQTITILNYLLDDLSS